MAASRNATVILSFEADSLQSACHSTNVAEDMICALPNCADTKRSALFVVVNVCTHYLFAMRQ